MSERQGIEIDYCPKCRGVWLDRGELDKIIERSVEYDEQRLRASGAAPRPTPPEFYNDDGYDTKRKNDRRYTGDQRSDDGRNDRDDEGRRHEKRRKWSFLDEVFDIFD